jgi:hypothetical protein
VGGGGGDPLILGRNILTFNAEQSEDQSKSEIKVKGQRSKKEEWGEKALLKTFKEVKDNGAKGFVPLTVQHYGDSDDKTLERRGRFEANKRSTESKKITIEVFHVQTPSGQPWDIGNTHYVEVPPEGIFETFECVELTYSVNADGDLKTKLTLSPPPSGGTGGGGGGGGGSGGGSAGAAAFNAPGPTASAANRVPPATTEPDDYETNGGGYGLGSINTTIGEAPRAQAGIPYVEGQYPDPWVGPQLVEMPFMTLADKLIKKAKEEAEKENEEEEREPPLVLPHWFGEVNE